MAATGFALPSKLALTGDTIQAWKTFKQKFNLYMLAAGHRKKSEEEKVALLLTIGGDELLERYNSFDFSPPKDSEADPALILSEVIRKFDAHFAPRETTLISRYTFRRCQQLTDMSLDAFITKLKNMVKDCGYGDQKDEQLRDQLVFGCRDDKLREKFFKEESLSFEDALKICVAHQATQKQMSVFQDENKEAIYWVGHNMKRNTKPGTNNYKHNTSAKECKFCGTIHQWRKELCPAYGKMCSLCGNANHFARVCKSRSQMKHMRTPGKNVNSVHNQGDTSDDQEAEDDEFSVQYVMKINQGAQYNMILSAFEVGGNKVKFQIDSGASVNIIPRRLLPDAELNKSEAVLCMWNSTKIYPVGECRTIMKNCTNGKRYSVNFVVVEQDFTPILGKKAYEQMDL